MQENTELELLVRDAWFRAQGFARLPELGVHANDDMARQDVVKTDPERRLMEYMRSGHEALRVLENVLACAGRELADVQSFLDFAGGYGRMLRFLVRRLAPARVWSSDILAGAVEFVATTFGVQGFRSAAAVEDIPFPRRFEVVFVGSLFSHLPRATFALFLRALHDVLEDDGLLVFSTHNPEILSAERRDPSGFTFTLESESRELDKAAYGSTFVAPELVRRIGEELGIAHLYSLEHELWRIQDVYVAARRPVPGLERWQHAPIGRGRMLRCDVDARGLAWAEGYVRVPSHETPIAALEILVDGARRIPALHHELAGALPASEGGARFRQIDWRVSGAAPELSAATHTVAALVTTKSGAQTCFDATRLARAPA